MRIKIIALATLSVLWAAPCTAQEGGSAAYYDKDAITAAANSFAAVAGELQKSYLPLERQVSRTDSLLAELDLNLKLTSGEVDGNQHKLWMARLNERSGDFGPSRIVFESWRKDSKSASRGHLTAPSWLSRPRGSMLCPVPQGQPGSAASAPALQQVQAAVKARTSRYASPLCGTKIRS